MRHAHYEMSREEAVALLTRAPTMSVAAVAPDGQPILRTVHGVVVDDLVAFHGAPKGEKSEMAGWPCVISTEEIIASVPSYFIDAERACPATTYYRSVQVAGALHEVTGPVKKAEILAALMAKLQPEGGHVPLDAEHPLYRNAVRGLLVMALPLERISGKAKVGQNRKPEDLGRVVEALWARGGPTDTRAIQTVLAHNPSLPLPSFLAGPEGARLCCAMNPVDLDAATALVEHEYWNTSVPREVIARSHLGSNAWVGAHDEAGTLIATARAISDRAKHAWIYDVAVQQSWRGRGLGGAIMRLLLAHPEVRGASRVHLGTLDAQTFYAPFGFAEAKAAGPTAGSVHMMLSR